jgi:TatA/E family protein of Tat protein translocase
MRSLFFQIVQYNIIPLRSFDTLPYVFYDAKTAPGAQAAELLMLSIPHLIVIFVVALIVFGPEKLPELARNFGKVMAEFKRATGELQSTFEGHLRDLERESDQRRIGGDASTPPPVQGAAAPAAPGTVPADPPHAAATGGPAVAAGSTAGSPAGDTAQRPDDPPIEPNHEMANHGGSRPA